MDPTTALQAMQSWTPEDQLDFLFRAWDQLIDSGWHLEPSDDLKAELDRRLAAYQAGLSRGLTWEQVVAHVKRPR